MVVGALLALVLGVVLGLVTRLVRHPELPRLGSIVIGGYVLRLGISLVLRDVPLFSHGTGGDSQTYEQLAILISRIWSVSGFHFVTADEIPQIGATSLPPNLFAAVLFMNGGAPSQLGCSALVALAAGLTFVNMLALSIELGADPKHALRTVSLFYFGLVFVHYTSDTFKDGLVVCFTMGALGSAVRLSRRFSLLHIAIGVVSLLALWFVRFYLIFVATAPLFVGLVGLGSRSVVRPVLASLLIVAGGVALLAFSDFGQAMTERASTTFEVGTARNVLESNASTGSGVAFDDGGNPFGALGPKLAYTLFSPFPWAGGSFGFHVGKLDAFIWYYFMYRAVGAARQLWSRDRTLVLMLGTFLLPCAVMYATSMANVGLIVRQRLVLVAVTALLAALYRPALQPQRQPAAGEAKRGRLMRPVAS